MVATTVVVVLQELIVELVKEEEVPLGLEIARILLSLLEEIMGMV